MALDEKRGDEVAAIHFHSAGYGRSISGVIWRAHAGMTIPVFTNHKVV
jgi:hypothetical protein